MVPSTGFVLYIHFWSWISKNYIYLHWHHTVFPTVLFSSPDWVSLWHIKVPEQKNRKLVIENITVLSLSSSTLLVTRMWIVAHITVFVLKLLRLLARFLCKITSVSELYCWESHSMWNSIQLLPVCYIYFNGSGVLLSVHHFHTAWIVKFWRCLRVIVAYQRYNLLNSRYSPHTTDRYDIQFQISEVYSKCTGVLIWHQSIFWFPYFPLYV